MAMIALVTIVLAYFIGTIKSETDLVPFLKQTMPQASRFEPLTRSTFAAWQERPVPQLIGYIGIGNANGYGGTLTVAVAVDSDGTIFAISIIEQSETYSFLRRVLKSDLLASLSGKSFKEPFKSGLDLDGVTGATYTSGALIDAVKKGVRQVAAKHLKLPVPIDKPPPVKFGTAELVLIFLFIIGFLGHQPWFGPKKLVRWTSMVIGLLFLGFIYNDPLTLNYVNKLLLGFLPGWRTHLYWYLLMGGILLVILVNKRNPYCEWFCPFGAAQECFASLGGAGKNKTHQYSNFLKWIPRGLAWLAIVLALIFRNPGISSYEIFGTLFKLIGTNYQFALLSLVLVAALFMRRPWCRYLCPLRPVTDFIRLIRNWIIEIWRKLIIKPIG